MKIDDMEGTQIDKDKLQISLDFLPKNLELKLNKKQRKHFFKLTRDGKNIKINPNDEFIGYKIIVIKPITVKKGIISIELLLFFKSKKNFKGYLQKETRVYQKILWSKKNDK